LPLIVSNIKTPYDKESELTSAARFGLICDPHYSAGLRLVGYPSGQRGQTVNLLAYAFTGSNPVPTTTFNPLHLQALRAFEVNYFNQVIIAHSHPFAPEKTSLGVTQTSLSQASVFGSTGSSASNSGLLPSN
jgi:hypothetical protein